MRTREMKRLERRGYVRKVHEKNLDMPRPMYEDIQGRLPMTVSMNGYRINFRDETIGGFKVDIHGKDDKHVACGVKLSRWHKTDIRDRFTGNYVELDLSFLSPHNLKLTVLERHNF